MDNTPRRAPATPTLAGVPDYLTLDQVADALGITVDDAYQLVRAGQLSGTWVPDRDAWYVRRDAVDQYRQAE